MKTNVSYMRGSKTKTVEIIGDVFFNAEFEEWTMIGRDESGEYQIYVSSDNQSWEQADGWDDGDLDTMVENNCIEVELCRNNGLAMTTKNGKVIILDHKNAI